MTRIEALEAARREALAAMDAAWAEGYRAKEAVKEARRKHSEAQDAFILACKALEEAKKR